MTIHPAEQFLVLPVPFRRVDGRLHLELQAHHGVRCWCDNFESLIVAAPLMPESVAQHCPEMAWLPADQDAFPRVQFLELPWAFTPLPYLACRRATRRILASCIDRADYLQFAIGGFIGDWAGEAAELAWSLRRPYAVHMDRVEHRVILLNSKDAPARRRLKNRLTSPLMRRWHRRLITRAAVSLCHGRDCWEAYHAWCPNSHLIHDIHIESAQIPTPSQIRDKAVNALGTDPLQVCYAGRLAPDKAPLEWLRAIAYAVRHGASLRAAWLGDGPLRAEMESQRDALGLQSVVTLPGFISDRAAVIRAIQQAHLMVFTHITPESPRCLIEALLFGTPLIGYDSPYARDLIARHHGGELVALHDIPALGQAILRLHNFRQNLSALIQAAARDGAQFDARSVFEHRSALVRRYAGRIPAPVPLPASAPFPPSP